MIDPDFSSNNITPEQLADLHEALARNMLRMHHDALEIQSILSDKLTSEVASISDGTKIQHLDRHAQMLEDFSRVLSRCAQEFRRNGITVEELKEVCTLPSTVDALFNTKDHTSSGDKGDLVLL